MLSYYTEIFGWLPLHRQLPLLTVQLLLRGAGGEGRWDYTIARGAKAKLFISGTLVLLSDI